MILALLALLAAPPAVEAEMTRIADAVPEAAHVSALEPATAAWIGRLPTVAQRDVALLVMLSYGQPARGKHVSTAANVAMGLAYAAALEAQNQDPRLAPRDYTISGPVPMRAPADDMRGVRAVRAQRALAWGHRLGLCDAAFVTALRALPAPGAPGDPDLRPVVRDLGMLAYNPDCVAADQAPTSRPTAASSLPAE